MGFLSKIFGNLSEEKEEKVLPWIDLNALEQLKDIGNKSIIKPQIIFKYSNRCGINRMVLNQFIDQYQSEENDFDLYFLDLINYREVSNEVARKFQVTHESPQLLVVKNGMVVAHASHGSINEIELSKFV